jgi:hypothetical protein
VKNWQLQCVSTLSRFDKLCLSSSASEWYL